MNYEIELSPDTESAYGARPQSERSAGQKNRDSFLPQYTLLTLVPVLLLAFALRIYGIESETPWNDEVLSVQYLDAPDFATFAELTYESDATARPTPVYSFLSYHWSRLVGNSIYHMRTMSVAFSLGTLLFLFLTARALFNGRAALYACFIFAMALPHIYYAQEIRAYALTTFLASVSLYTFVRAVNGKSHAVWVVHVVVNGLLALSHLFAPLLWPGQALFLLIFRRQWKGRVLFWGVTHLTFAVAYFFWLRSMDSPMLPYLTSAAGPLLSEIGHLSDIYAGGRFSTISPSTYLPTYMSFDRVLAVGSLLLMAWIGLRALGPSSLPKDHPKREMHRKQREAFVLLGMWLVLPPLILWVLSKYWEPVFAFHYTLYASLGLYVLVGAAISSFSFPAARSIVLTGMCLIFIHQLLVLPTVFRPDYRSAESYIREHGTSRDAIIVYKEGNGRALRFSAKIEDERIRVHERYDGFLREVTVKTISAPNVWVVLWRSEEADDFPAFLYQHQISFKPLHFRGIPPLVVYHLRGRPAPERHLQLATHSAFSS